MGGLKLEDTLVQRFQQFGGGKAADAPVVQGTVQVVVLQKLIYRELLHQAGTGKHHRALLGVGVQAAEPLPLDLFFPLALLLPQLVQKGVSFLFRHGLDSFLSVLV